MQSNLGYFVIPPCPVSSFCFQLASLCQPPPLSESSLAETGIFRQSGAQCLRSSPWFTKQSKPGGRSNEIDSFTDLTSPAAVLKFIGKKKQKSGNLHMQLSYLIGEMCLS